MLTSSQKENHLALVHIPVDVYPFFVQPILQLLFHELPPMDGSRTEGDDMLPCEMPRPAFLNFSLTPVGCSVIGPRKLVNLLFQPVVEKFNQTKSPTAAPVTISEEEFVAMQVYGSGLGACQRVVDLTSPLAKAGLCVYRKGTLAMSDLIR